MNQLDKWTQWKEGRKEGNKQAKKAKHFCMTANIHGTQKEIHKHRFI